MLSEIGIFNLQGCKRVIENENISESTFIGTFITPKGSLVINYSSEIIGGSNLYVLGNDITTYATFKDGEYSKYLYVKVKIDVSQNDFRVVTISY